MPRGTAVAQGPGKVLNERQQATLTQFISLVNQVPDAPEGDVTDLLGPIMAAASWEQLNTTDTLPSSKTLAGTEIKLDSIAKKVSDKDSLTGYYLFCEGVNLKTGESIRFTAGGSQAVAVMSQLYVLRELPAKIRFDAVEVPGVGEAINCRVLDVYRTIVDG